MEPFCFCPLRDRVPQGGVPAGQEVSFCLTANGSEERRVLLIVENDADKGLEQIELTREGASYSCRFTPARAGLYWYHFYVEEGETRYFLCCGERLRAVSSERMTQPFQLTVYNGAFRADWFRGRIMYHVFVDRFAVSGKVRTKLGTILHDNVRDVPEYLPVDGKIRNRDFFGGNFAGIAEKLDYLKSLGVGVLYLSPIFEATSNHRYDTGDYERIDPILGTEEDFLRLLEEARTRDIAVVLDGVFNHTGDDSKYFNKYGNYASTGAYQSEQSPYRDWYCFEHYPYTYRSWWGIDTLPSVNQQSVGWLEYIAGAGGVIDKWTKLGVSGWRLDVVDELCDNALDAVCHRVREVRKDAVVIGEVWEDASNKSAYGVRRRYFQGGQLDSAMNYPVKDAIIRWMTTGKCGEFVSVTESLADHYPPDVLHSLMNILSTHDTVRILTMLGGMDFHLNRQQRAEARLGKQQREIAVLRLKQAALLQYTLPGVPCIYYGDEAGLEGYEDPFNRRFFPWGEEEPVLQDWYRFLGRVRAENAVFRDGAFRFLLTTESAALYERGDGEILAGCNCGGETLCYPLIGTYRNLITDADESVAWLFPGSFVLLKKE